MLKWWCSALNGKAKKKGFKRESTMFVSIMSGIVILRWSANHHYQWLVAPIMEIVLMVIPYHW